MRNAEKINFHLSTLKVQMYKVSQKRWTIIELDVLTGTGAVRLTLISKTVLEVRFLLLGRVV